MKSLLVNGRSKKYSDTLDFYPTPPWATRALCEFVVMPKGSVLEPACGEYHISNTLKEYNLKVTSKDIMYGDDFLACKSKKKYDWVITNPPYEYASEFLQKSLALSNVGTAFLVRYTFLESKKRYETIFRDNPPSVIGQFTERIAFNSGRMSKVGKTGVAYCWVVWLKENNHSTQFLFIPPCKNKLEREKDYG